MRIQVEFPTHILEGYKGPGNLDETLDDNITYLLGRFFYENKIDFKIHSLKVVSPQPNVNDGLVRYDIEIGLMGNDFDAQSMILDELAREGYEKGLTIRGSGGEVHHADLYTADIQLRRRLQK